MCQTHQQKLDLYFYRQLLQKWYLSPVRGSRTVAFAEKTMNETLILGLKTNQKKRRRHLFLRKTT